MIVVSFHSFLHRFFPFSSRNYADLTLIYKIAKPVSWPSSPHWPLTTLEIPSAKSHAVTQRPVMPKKVISLWALEVSSTQGLLGPPSFPLPLLPSLLPRAPHPTLAILPATTRYSFPPMLPVPWPIRCRVKLWHEGLVCFPPSPYSSVLLHSKSSLFGAMKVKSHVTYSWHGKIRKLTFTNCFFVLRQVWKLTNESVRHLFIS